MATFDYTKFHIIKEAMRKVGAVKLNEEPEAYDLESASIQLHAIVQDLRNDGVLLWTLEEVTLNLEAGTGAYTPPADTLSVDRAFIRYNGADHPVTVITNATYDSQVDKTTRSIPDAINFNAKLSPSLRLYPVPDQAYELHYVRVRALADMLSAGVAPDVPDNWVRALIFRLAADLAPNRRLPVEDQVVLERKADHLIKRAKGSTRERTDENTVEPSPYQ